MIREARARLGRLPKWLPGGRLAQGTFVVMVCTAARLALQLCWVVLLARALGVDGYGQFSGIVALALALSGLVGLGLGLRLYQDVARDPGVYPMRWHQLRSALAWSACAVCVLFLGIARWQFSSDWWLLGAIAVAEVVLAPVIAQIAFAFAAHGRVGLAAFAPVVLSAARLAAIAVFSLGLDESVGRYALWHALATGCALGYLVLLQRHLLPATPGRHPLTTGDVRDGLPFCAVWTSSLALGGVDKAVVLRVGGAELAGHYSAAFRFVALAATPVDALVTAAMPRLFQRGRDAGLHRRLLGALTLATGLYGVLGGVAVWLCAGVLPRLLGAEFTEAADAAKLLAMYAPIYCLRTLGVNVLLGQGERWWRFAGEAGAILVIATIAILAIAAWGMAGAVAALLVGEMLLLVWVWARVFTIETAWRRAGNG